LPPAFVEFVVQSGDPSFGARAKPRLRLTVLFWLIGSAVLLYKPVMAPLTAENRKLDKQFLACKLSIGVEPYLLTHLFFPSADMRGRFLANVAMIRAQAAKDKKDAPTTDTLRRELVADGETIILQFVRARGAAGPADIADPGFRARIEDLRARLWHQWLDEQAGLTPEQHAQAPLARQFAAVLVEPFQLAMFSRPQQRFLIRGPADPALGALRFDPFKEALPAASRDAKTTGTAQTTPAR
jgi:hypothetical protein